MPLRRFDHGFGAIRRSSRPGSLSPIPDAYGCTLRLKPPPGLMFVAKSTRGTSGAPIADSAAPKRPLAGAQIGATAVTHARSVPGASNVERTGWLGHCSNSPWCRIIAALSRQGAFHADATDV